MNLVDIINLANSHGLAMEKSMDKTNAPYHVYIMYKENRFRGIPLYIQNAKEIAIVPWRSAAHKNVLATVALDFIMSYYPSVIDPDIMVLKRGFYFSDDELDTLFMNYSSYSDAHDMDRFVERALSMFARYGHFEYIPDVEEIRANPFGFMDFQGFTTPTLWVTKQFHDEYASLVRIYAQRLFN